MWRTYLGQVGGIRRRRHSFTHSRARRVHGKGRLFDRSGVVSVFACIAIAKYNFQPAGE